MLKKQDTGLTDQVAAMSAVHKGLSAAVGEVKQIETLITQLDAFAKAQHLHITGDGTVSDALGTVALPKDKVETYNAERKAAVEAGAAKVRAILKAASATDSTLNGILTKAKQGKYASSGNPTLAQAALGAEQQIPGTVNVPPPPKGSSPEDYAAWYASLTKEQQAQVRGNKDVMQQISDAKLHVTGSDDNSSLAADPVHTGSGNFLETEDDLVFSGRLEGLSWSRTYNSRSATTGGGFGGRWCSPAQVLMQGRDGGVALTLPDGREVFIPRQGRTFGRAEGFPVVVSAGPLDEFVLTFNDGGVWEFDLHGQLAATSLGPGTRVEYQYDRADGARRLAGLRHVDTGVQVDVSWEGGRIGSVSSTDGRHVEYTYDEALRLVGTQGGPAGDRTYRYDEAGYLFEVVDADGVVEVSNTYDDRGRVLSQVSPTGNVTDFVYLPDHTTAVEQRGTGVSNVWFSDGFGRCTGITDGNGATSRIEYDAVGNPIRYVSRSGAITDQWFDDLSRLVKRKTPDGAQTVFEWDGLNRVTAVERLDPGVEPARWEMTYDGSHRSPATVVDPLGGVVRVTQDAWGQVTRVVDQDGVVVTANWDELGRLTELVDGMGAPTRFEHDAAGRPVARVYPSGARLEYAYDAAGRLARVQSPDGAVWSWEYSAAGRPVAVIDPTGTRTETRYGSHGMPSSLVEADGAATDYEWDLFQNLVGITEPDGARWQFEFDPVQRPVASIDPLGGRWSTGFDVEGNAVSVTDPTGRGVSCEVDVMGRPVSVSDGVTTTRTEYDGSGRVVSQVGTDGGVTSRTYDVLGRMVTVSDPAGGVTRIDYTPAGRMSAMTSPTGTVERYEYDAAGRVCRIVDALGGVSAVEYTVDSVIASRTYPGGARETYEHDALGRVVAVHSADAGTARYAYDALGRLTAASDAAFGDRRFVYDAVGNLVETVDGNGGVTRYTYDRTGQVTSQTDPLGNTTTWTYDLAGRATSMTDPLGRSMFTEYDAAGRKARHTVGDGSSLTWTYDGSGRVAGLVARSADGAEEEFVVDTDWAGRAVTWRSVTRGEVRLTVDANGNLTGRTRTTPDGVVSLGWGYDADGNRTSFTHDDGSVTTYRVDALGAVVGLAHPQVGEATIERDGLGRAVKVAAPGVVSSWEYGSAGVTHHRVSRNEVDTVTRVGYDAAGRVNRLVETVDGDGLPVGGWTRLTEYSYDGAGQLVAWRQVGPDGPVLRARLAYDPCGRLVRETHTRGDALVSTRSFTYDAAGQLVSATEPDRHGVVRTSRYVYNDAGNRVREEHGDGTVREFFYDARGFTCRVVTTTSTVTAGGVRTVTHDSADDAVIAGDASRELWVDALGELARVDAQVVVFDSADEWAPLSRVGETVLVGSGATAAMVGPTGSGWLSPGWQGQSGAGEVDPFGLPGIGGRGLDAGIPLPRSGAESGSSSAGGGLSGSLGGGLSLGMGGELDVDGLTWLRYRMYDPGTRAFTAPDLLPPVPGSGSVGNTYAYAANNPVSLIDPWGLSPVSDEDAKKQSEHRGGWGGLWDKVKDKASDAGHWVANHKEDLGHTALDMAGMIPVVGSVADGANAVWYAAEGDYKNAAMSAASAVPVVGDAAAAAKYGVKGVQKGEDAVKAAKEAEKAAEAAGKSSPRTVFRGDSRSPDQIFKEGFHARGGTDDLLDYAKNNTPSQYISTSKDRSAAVQFTHQPGRQSGWVYSVRDDGRGIDVNETLGHRSPYPEEKEIAFPDRIHPHQIKSARFAHRGRWHGPEIPNPRYRP